MNTNNKTTTTTNLLNNSVFKTFIEVQATYGFAQRGGSKIPGFSADHSKRIASDVNILSGKELKRLVFNENVYNN
jgi:hypothetical protein